MIGKEVVYAVADSSGNNSTATGTVTSVMTSDGTTYVVVNGSTAVELSAI
jgi:hypothetical protein